MMPHRWPSRPFLHTHTHSCLFQDSTGSSKFNPDAFFPMVLSERVAWPEYMEMVRAALAKQAEAIIKQGAALESGSIGGRGGAGEQGSAGRNDDGVSGGDLSRPGGQPGAAAAEDPASTNVCSGNDPAPLTPRQPSDCQDLETATATAEIRRLTLGKTLRGTTAGGPESWSLFRFELPSAGPILTIVLDIADGEPDVVVSRGASPSAGLCPQDTAVVSSAVGANGNVLTVGAPSAGGAEGERGDSTAALVGMPMLPRSVGGGVGGDGGKWKASATHRDLRVVKIFPRDPG